MKHSIQTSLIALAIFVIVSIFSYLLCVYLDKIYLKADDTADAVTKLKYDTYKMNQTHFEAVKQKITVRDSVLQDSLAKALIEAASNFEHISVELLCSLIATESNFNSSAIGSSGEKGLMQIMNATAIWTVNTFDLPVDYDLHNIDDNLLIGCTYLNDLIEDNGLLKGLSIYNTGRLSPVGKRYAYNIIDDFDFHPYPRIAQCSTTSSWVSYHRSW